MCLVLAAYQPELLTSARRAKLYQNYFHPAYLVENGVKAFEGQEIRIPQVQFGPQTTPLGDNSYESVNSESDSEPTESDSEPSYMRAPWKYTLENYKNNPKKRRPATKRKRSRGASSSADGGAPPNRRAPVTTIMESYIEQAIHQCDLENL